jgi:putative FmdB family regulatory protein
MPLYEYRCGACGRRYSVLVGVVAGENDLRCPSCGADEPERLISKFVRGRSEDQRIDEVADRLESMGEPDSPGEVRHVAREMGKALDDDMSDEMEELMETELAGAEEYEA